MKFYDYIIFNKVCFAKLQNHAHTKKHANFVVDSWLCSPGPGGIAVPEGQSLNLTATLSYHGSVQPPVTWYEDGQQLEAQTVVMHDFNQNVLT